MDLNQITPLILTLNEASNLRRNLEKLAWADEVVVIDSYSNDETLEIANSFPNVRIIQREFDTHTAQWNFGLEQVQTNWVLSLDADYTIDDGFVEEVRELKVNERTSGFESQFRYLVFARPLCASLYPPRVILFRRDRARYKDDGHTQRLAIEGDVSRLDSVIDHDDRKPFRVWFSNQTRYAKLEAKKLCESSWNSLAVVDRVRKCVVLAPILILPYCLIVKRGALDGLAGWTYALQRTLAELILSLCVISRRIGRTE